MDTQESTSREFLFKPRQFLGAPLVQAPPKAGYISAAVQFTVPALAVGKSQHAAVLKLCERLGRQTYAAAIKKGDCRRYEAGWHACSDCLSCSGS
jgi:hypothetical protein